MAIEKSYTRLGLFLVIAIVVVLATALLFVRRMRSREVIELVTYTQENVAGLDISSAVRYRGVPVGRVSNLQVEPGGRTIEIDFEFSRIALPPSAPMSPTSRAWPRRAFSRSSALKWWATP